MQGAKWHRSHRIKFVENQWWCPKDETKRVDLVPAKSCKNCHIIEVLHPKDHYIDPEVYKPCPMKLHNNKL